MFLRADDNGRFSVVLSLFLTAGGGTSGTHAISFSFTRMLKEIRSTMMIVVHYYKVNKQCAPDATALAPGGPNLNLGH